MCIQNLKNLRHPEYNQQTQLKKNPGKRMNVPLYFKEKLRH